MWKLRIAFRRNSPPLNRRDPSAKLFLLEPFHKFALGLAWFKYEQRRSSSPLKNS